MKDHESVDLYESDPLSEKSSWVIPKVGRCRLRERSLTKAFY